MTESASVPDDFRSLIDAVVCTESATDTEIAELMALLDGNVAAQRFYLEYCRLHAELSLSFQGEPAHQTTLDLIDRQEVFSSVRPSPSLLASAFGNIVSWGSTGTTVAPSSFMR